MSRATVSITRPRSEQGDLDQHREHASADPELLRPLGLEVGRQAIIRRNDSTFALYTLTDDGAEQDPGAVRMGDDGRGRLDGAGEEQFEALLDSVAVDPDATELEARSGEKLLELLDGPGHRGRLIVLAPHGGDIEPFTDRQAEHVRDLLADVGVTCWRCKGWKPGGGAVARWHITSTDISTASFPRLGTVATRGFRHAVSFHGFTEQGRPDVLIGGAASDALKRVMRAVIAFALTGTDLRVEIAEAGDPLGGTEEDNVVNRFTRGRRNGVQIEQQVRARTGTVPCTNQPTWQAIATAVADVYRLVVDRDSS